jgi:hypothetical protein
MILMAVMPPVIALAVRWSLDDVIVIACMSILGA